ncbi:hypothetical protein [Nonomuraea rubra]|uniref:hypothetical protein n=1 Tax=Nonomuraea rubra TaxID=46180 RepID=UPI0031EC8336
MLTVFPFYWMVRTALTPAGDLYTDSTALWPDHPTLINFARVLGLVDAETARAAGGSGRTAELPALHVQLDRLQRADRRRADLLLRHGGLRLRAAALPRPGPGLHRDHRRSDGARRSSRSCPTSCWSSSWTC